MGDPLGQVYGRWFLLGGSASPPFHCFILPYATKGALIILVEGVSLTCLCPLPVPTPATVIYSCLLLLV